MLAVIVSPVAAYLLTATILGSIVVNADHTEPESGVEIFVVTFDVHADIMVPLRNPAMDWSPWFPFHDFKEPRYGDYVMFGWGDREFYTRVREWKDLTAGAALRGAFLQTPTLMHISHWRQPMTTNQVQRVVLTETNYARLCEHLQSGFRLNEHGGPILVTNLTYRGWDAFYEATGRYDGVNNCNEWAGRALRKAGVRTGLWTPGAGQIRARLAERPKSEK